MNQALSAQVKNLIVSPTQRELDSAMVPYDIWGTRAHVLMLASSGIVDRPKAAAILNALQQIEARYTNGEFKIDPELGAQLTLEKEIVELAGEEAGLSTHTARSRNDQVMVTELLYLRAKTLELLGDVGVLSSAFLELGAKHIETVMPGYTHMQPGKPTTFAHWCLAYHDAIKRAGVSVLSVLERYDACPLGAVESFGTSWPIDRAMTAKLLGFAQVWEVPQDAISSRGFFQLELLAALNSLAIIGSKIATDLLLYTTFEYNLVTLGDTVAKRLHPITGSSVMPQKRNPDVLELARAIAPQVSAAYNASAGLLTALPTGYNRDAREIKEYIHIGLTKVKSLVSVLAEVLSSLEVNKERCLNLVRANYSLTTELADAVAQRFKLPYRQVYKVVGETVKDAISRGISLEEISVEELSAQAARHSLEIKISKAEFLEIIDPLAALQRRKHIGGSAAPVTQTMLLKRRDELKQNEKNIQARLDIIAAASAHSETAAAELM